jgi:hypothetical protein
VGGWRALRTAAATAPPTATAAELVHGPRLAAAPAGGLVVSGSLVESSENAGGGEDAEIVRKISPPFLFFGLFLFGIFLPEFFFPFVPSVLCCRRPINILANSGKENISQLNFTSIFRH